MASSLTAAIGPDGLAGILADATAKATLLLLLSWFLAVTLRRQSAALRHRLWAAALCGSIAVPMASWLVPGWRLAVFPAPPQSVNASLPATLPASTAPLAVSLHATPGAIARAIPVPAPARAASDRRVIVIPPSQRLRIHEVNSSSTRSDGRLAGWSIPGRLLTVWGVGAFAVALPALVGLLCNQRLRRRSRRVSDEGWLDLLASLRRELSICRNVELVQSAASPIPLTWGVMRPVILLPEDAPCWPPRRRRLVLLHELAHIRRFDAGVQLAGRVAAVLYWFHPLAWYALHRLRLECEHACDDCVVLAGERPSDYASDLLELARSVRTLPVSMNIAMARTNLLEHRLRSLFDETRSHLPVDRRSGGLVAAGALALVLGLAVVRPGFSARGLDGQARAAGSTPSAQPAASQAGEPLAQGTGRITGRVVRGEGREAVSAAEVVILLPPPKGQDFYIGKRPLRRTTTDAKGTFSFDRLAPGRYRVWANFGKLTSRPRQARGEVVMLPESGEAPKPVELRLVPGVRVTVRVKERATGKPIKGATVQPGWSDLVDDFTTGRDGQTQAQPLTPERWLLEVWADGFAKQSHWMNLENGSDAIADFLLEPGGDLEGIVRDPSGKPVAGVGLSVFPEGSNEQFAYVETDAGGRYRLPNLPLSVALRIQDLGKGEYAHETTTTRLTGPKQKLDLTLRLRPHGGSIVGVVRDNQGRPIAGADVRNPGRSSGDFREAKTGPDGRFRLENLYDTLTGKEVIVRAPGFAPRRMKVEPGPAEKPAEVTITLEPGHRIQGRVTDDKGRALEGVNVYFSGGNGPHPEGGKTTTDAQGRFSFDSLPPDSPFVFQKNGYSPIDNRQLPLDGDDVVTVEMVPAGLILGKVLDAATGKPIRAFNVQITFSPERQPGDPSSGLRSDLINPGQAFQSNEGRFKLSELLAGMPLQVMISAQGYERHVTKRVAAAVPDEARVNEFRLDPLDTASLRTYHGRLRDADGKPVAGAQVRLIAARDRDPDQRAQFPFNWTMIHNGQLAQQPNVFRFLQSSTDARGLFEFTGIPKGTEVELAWWGRGIAPGRADHMQRHAEQEEGWFDITLPAPARIAGKIDRKSYTTAGRIQLTSSNGLCDYTDLELKPDQVDFAFEDLAPGQYTVHLMTAFEPIPGQPGALTNRALTTATVTLAAGDRVRVEFTP
jgi:beta-lactamase regulating signal transducer with metallopeptidase domain